MKKVSQNSKAINNVFLGRKDLIVAAIKSATTPYGAARILSRELSVPHQIAAGVVLLSDRSLRRLCNNA